MQAFWRRSILVRAAMQVVGIGLVVGLGFVFLTAHLTERSNQQGVSQRIRELMTTVESTVQIACFTKDPALALEVVNGLARNSEVFGAVIVGELLIDPDPEIVSTRVKESGAFVALLLGLQLLAVVSAVAAAVVLWIVRPIKRMSDKLHVMDAHSIESLEVPRGHENTEIGRLAADINQLGQRLKASLDEEHHLHVQREIGERKYRAIFENADSGIFVVDQHLVLESCNHAFFRRLGLPPQAAARDKLDLLRLRWREPGALARLVEQCAVLNRSVSDDFEYAGGDAEVKTLPNATLVTVRIATGESYTDRSGSKVDRTDWHLVACWGQMADQARGIRKGDVVQVEGKIRTRSYDKGGEKRYVTEIIASKITCDAADREPQIQRDDVPDRSEDEIPF